MWCVIRLAHQCGCSVRCHCAESTHTYTCIYIHCMYIYMCVYTVPRSHCYIQGVYYRVYRNHCHKLHITYSYSLTVMYHILISTFVKFAGCKIMLN